jgi:hypothetical protein
MSDLEDIVTALVARQGAFKGGCISSITDDLQAILG